MDTTDALIAAQERLNAARAAYLAAESWVRTCKSLGDRTALDAARLEGAAHRFDDAGAAYEAAEIAFYAAAEAELAGVEAELAGVARGAAGSLVMTPHESARLAAHWESVLPLIRPWRSLGDTAYPSDPRPYLLHPSEAAVVEAMRARVK